MDVVADLIRSITEFMHYFAPGFIFLGCMNFSSCKKREEKAEYLILNSIAISFIISTVSDCIVRNFSYYDERAALFSDLRPVYLSVISIVISVISGLSVGMLCRKKQINQLSQVLFHRDFRSDFFVFLKDEMTKDYSVILVRIKRKNDSCVYVGQIERVLKPAEKPVLILFNYARYDEKGKKLSHRDGEYRMIVNYEDVESFEYIIIRNNAGEWTKRPQNPC